MLSTCHGYLNRTCWIASSSRRGRSACSASTRCFSQVSAGERAQKNRGNNGSCRDRKKLLAVTESIYRNGVRNLCKAGNTGTEYVMSQLSQSRHLAFSQTTYLLIYKSAPKARMLRPVVGA